jgi:hypothetical protein
MNEQHPISDHQATPSGQAGSHATLRMLVARLEHKEIEGEFDSLKRLDNEALERAKERHFARRQPPAENDNLCITLLVAVIGAPGSLLGGLFTGEVAYYFGAAVWSVVVVPLYVYLAHTAKYWREHNAIRGEEIRRYGHASFG